MFSMSSQKNSLLKKKKYNRKLCKAKIENIWLTLTLVQNAVTLLLMILTDRMESITRIILTRSKD
jgi:hypothetical protein